MVHLIFFGFGKTIIKTKIETKCDDNMIVKLSSKISDQW
jgi:hypothetical protein